MADDRFEKIERTLEFLADAAARREVHASKTDQQIAQLTQLVNDIALGTARLLHAVESHERRIDKLESRGE